jgi:hypothetical protein
MLVTLLTGCSLVSVTYNRLPTWMLWRLDAMLGLTDTQSAVVRPALTDWHDWHRQAHLPRYAAALRQWQVLARDDLTADQVCQAFGQVREWGLQAAERLLPVMAALAPSLSDAQIDRWNRHQRRQDARFAQDFIDPPGQVSPQRLKRAIDRAEMLYGRLDEDQRTWLAQRLADNPFDSEHALAQRQRRHAETVATVERIRAGADPMREVQAGWNRVLVPPTEAERRASEQQTLAACAQLAELHNRTTAAQRERAVQRLQGFEREFLALSNGR